MMWKKDDVKFIVFVDFLDVATKLWVMYPRFRCDFLEMRAESEGLG